MLPLRYDSLIPGSVVQVQSDIPGIQHKGMVEFPDWFSGERFIHSSKGRRVEISSRQSFAGNRPIVVLWTPQNKWQQEAALARMRSIIGLPYDLFEANCEHVINWALTGEPRSEQLVAGVAAVLIGGLVVGLLSLAKES